MSGEKYALSVRDGHQQVFFKCTRCSLEFFLMTWRTPHEVIEFFKPRATDSTSAAKHAGWCESVHCPECGSFGPQTVWMFGQRHCPWSIFEFVTEEHMNPIMRRVTLSRINVPPRETPRDLPLEKLPEISPPDAPWQGMERDKRFVQSLRLGHQQVAFKCQRCSLEFVTLSWRKWLEVVEFYQPHAGENGGFCKKVHCPECGTADRAVYLMRQRYQPKSITQFVMGCAPVVKDDEGRYGIAKDLGS